VCLMCVPVCLCVCVCVWVSGCLGVFDVCVLTCALFHSVCWFFWCALSCDLLHRSFLFPTSAAAVYVFDVCVCDDLRSFAPCVCGLGI